MNPSQVSSQNTSHSSPLLVLFKDSFFSVQERLDNLTQIMENKVALISAERVLPTPIEQKYPTHPQEHQIHELRTDLITELNDILSHTVKHIDRLERTLNNLDRII